MKKLILAVSVLALAACDKKEEPRLPTAEEQRAEHLANAEKNRKLQDLLEQQRATALGNVETNARGYFASNPRFDSSWKIVGHTDDCIHWLLHRGGFPQGSVCRSIDQVRPEPSAPAQASDEVSAVSFLIFAGTAAVFAVGFWLGRITKK